jgi:hypothetical protein
MDEVGAIEKIIKHLHSPKKFSKCLQLILKLMKDKFDFLLGTCLFNTFDCIMRYSRKFEQPSDRQVINQIYDFLLELGS